MKRSNARAGRFATKEEARRAVWDRLEHERIARFPFPPHGRIPNFAGARDASRRLFEHSLLAGARRIKVNPDAPQRPVREEALRRGIAVYVPTPRLRGGFRVLDPSRIPKDRVAEAASLSRGRKWSRPVSLEDLPPMDVIVAGSVAVTRDGRRCGKGEGYGDIEYAVLRELGHPPAPVVTTVHPAQIVASFPRSRNDLPLALIVTPETTIEVRRGGSPPRGIDWALLGEDRVKEMPILEALRAKRPARRRPARSRARFRRSKGSA